MRTRYILTVLLVIIGSLTQDHFFKFQKQPEEIIVGSTEFLGDRNFWLFIPPEHPSPEDLAVVLTPWRPEEPEDFSVQRRETMYRIAVSTAQSIILGENCIPSPIIYHALPDTNVRFQDESENGSTVFLSTGGQLKMESKGGAVLSLVGRGTEAIWYSCESGGAIAGVIWVSL